MSGTRAIQRFPRQVKPVLSLDKDEARKRVIKLYKAWYRQVPVIMHMYHIPKSMDQMYARLREVFEENRNIEDIRVIDILVIKGQMELKETLEMWKQDHGVYDFFRERKLPQKEKSFLSDFMNGQ